ncbi:hypothetical protein SGPA1_31470 [Streptomyces misionensis JCM 4497]
MPGQRGLRQGAGRQRRRSRPRHRPRGRTRPRPRAVAGRRPPRGGAGVRAVPRRPAPPGPAPRRRPMDRGDGRPPVHPGRPRDGTHPGRPDGRHLPPGAADRGFLRRGVRARGAGPGDRRGRWPPDGGPWGRRARPMRHGSLPHPAPR